MHNILRKVTSQTFHFNQNFLLIIFLIEKKVLKNKIPLHLSTFYKTLEIAWNSFSFRSD